MKNSIIRGAVTALLLILTLTSLSLAQKDVTRIYWISVPGGPGGDFYITATEITFDQYDKFCDATGHEKPAATFGRGQQPVINVSVEDALAYCQWLSKETGALVRLPNDEEYAYAAQGGKDGNHYVFSGSGNPQEVAWFQENSEQDEYSEDTELPEARPHIVATRQPNLLGIYDMSGNVWEWVDTLGYAMGGSYQSDGQNCFPYAKVGQQEKTYRAINLGFRVIMKK